MVTRRTDPIECFGRRTWRKISQANVDDGNRVVIQFESRVQRVNKLNGLSYAGKTCTEDSDQSLPTLRET